MADDQDVLGKIRSQMASLRMQRAGLRQAFVELSNNLAQVCEGITDHFSGENVTLVENPAEHVYGHFFFSNGELGVAYRSEDDDYADAQSGELDPYGPEYQVSTLDNCSDEWLGNMVARDALTSLLSRLSADLANSIAATQTATQTVRRITENPSFAIAASFEQNARELGFDRILEEWKRAQSEILVNPEDAITHASSLIETLCKHLLEKMSVPVPNNQIVTTLFKETAKSLGLDPANQANPELTGLCGGLNTVTQQLGALRTKFGSAHGKDPSHISLTSSHARLAVNSAGCLATFLLDRWREKKENATSLMGPVSFESGPQINNPRGGAPSLQTGQPP